MSKSNTDIQKLILEELRELKGDMKAVREKDIPSIREDVAVVKERANRSAYLISGIGGLISVAVTSAIAKLTHN